MMRPLIAVAVLCLLAAQPAAAAWMTSKQGTASARTGTITAPTGVDCTRSGQITWSPVTGATGYDVWWSSNNGADNFVGPQRVQGAGHTVQGGNLRKVRVRAVAGTWLSAHVEKNCS